MFDTPVIERIELIRDRVRRRLSEAFGGGLQVLVHCVEHVSAGRRAAHLLGRPMKTGQFVCGKSQTVYLLSTP